MNILSADGSVTAKVSNKNILISGSHIETRAALRAEKKIAVVAVTDSGEYVAVVPRKTSDVIVYQWTENRWIVACVMTMPKPVVEMKWEEGFAPDLRMKSMNDTPYRLLLSGHSWQLVD